MSRNWRALKIKGDRTLILITLLLFSTSLLLVFSTTSGLAYRMDRSIHYYLLAQGMTILLGAVFIILLQRVNYKRVPRATLVFYMLSIILLVYVLLFGLKINDATRWLKVPFLNFTIQPSDLGKLALILFMARIISSTRTRIDSLRLGAFPLFLPVLLTCAIIAPANLATTIVMGITALIICFIAGVRKRHIVLIIVGGFTGICLLFAISKISGFGRGATWKHRLQIFVRDPVTRDDKDNVYQVYAAKFAIANGKLLGAGPGNGRQKNYLPEAFSDYIFSVILEEYGFLGGIVVMLLYMIFFWRCILIAWYCADVFGTYVVLGIGTSIVFQAILNMAMNVGLTPVCGLALPLISLGGSSILCYCISIGLVINVSAKVNIPENATSNIFYKCRDDLNVSLIRLLSRNKGQVEQ